MKEECTEDDGAAEAPSAKAPSAKAPSAMRTLHAALKEHAMQHERIGGALQEAQEEVRDLRERLQAAEDAYKELLRNATAQQKKAAFDLNNVELASKHAIKRRWQGIKAKSVELRRREWELERMERGHSRH
jgi:hypothetical protein